MKNYFSIIDYKKINTLCGIQHKKLPLNFVVKIIKGLDKCYLRSYLISYIRKAGYTKNHKWCYIPQFAINIILKEIKYKKKKGRYRK